MQRLSTIQKQIQQNDVDASQGHPWVMKCIVPYVFQSQGSLKNKTIVISGASRGIGLAIVLRAAQDGANVAILAKTVENNPKLPGTIYTAAEQIEKVFYAGGQALPIQCDIRSEQSVKEAIEKTVAKFGGIDILINNASAISLTGTLETPMKKYDLMNQINARGTYMLSYYCLPYLLKASNPHILNLAPPLNMEERWFQANTAYAIAKYGMSMCVLGMAGEFKEQVGVNALWPRTSISTAAVQNLLGGDESIKGSRNENIMADAAYIILTSNCKKTTGNFFIDDEVLVSVGQNKFDKYRINQMGHESELIPDFFC